jgi:hypothetical protein
MENRGELSVADSVRAQRDWLRERLADTVLHVPRSAQLWQAVEVAVRPLQAIVAGDNIATLVPLDQATKQPRGLAAQLEIDEKHAGALTTGMPVRLQSTLYNHRLHGWAEARIERVYPRAELGPDGQRRFRALAAITRAPFQIALGSSVHAEIVVGRKPVYRIILEQ